MFMVLIAHARKQELRPFEEKVCMNYHKIYLSKLTGRKDACVHLQRDFYLEGIGHAPILLNVLTNVLCSYFCWLQSLNGWQV